MYTLLVHINNENPIKLDVEELPGATDNAIVGKNPRARGDKELTQLEDGVSIMIIPWWRITYVEVLPDETETSDFPLPFRND